MSAFLFSVCPAAWLPGWASAVMTGVLVSVAIRAFGVLS
jgi:hypothetical protein